MDKIGIEKLIIIKELFGKFISSEDKKYRFEIMKIYLDSDDMFSGRELTFINSLLDNNRDYFNMFLHFTAFLMNWNLELMKPIGTFERMFLEMVKFDEDGNELIEYEIFKIYYEKFIQNIN